MASLTEIVAAIVVQSSAAAYSHFGVTLEPVRLDSPPAVERTVARSAPHRAAPLKVSARRPGARTLCPDSTRT
jgi:hypothetical protein